MDANDLAQMQEAINAVATMMNAVIAMSGQVREHAISLGVESDIADLMALETFRTTLQISFPSATP